MPVWIYAPAIYFVLVTMHNGNEYEMGWSNQESKLHSERSFEQIFMDHLGVVGHFVCE